MTILFLLALPRNISLHTVGCDMQFDDTMHPLD